MPIWLIILLSVLGTLTCIPIVIWILLILYALMMVSALDPSRGLPKEKKQKKGIL